MLEKQFISSERAADLQSDVKESGVLWRRMERKGVWIKLEYRIGVHTIFEFVVGDQVVHKLLVLL